MCIKELGVGETYGKVKYEVKILNTRLPKKAVLKEVGSNERNTAPLLDAALQGVDLFQAHAALILPRLTDRRLGQIHAHDVIPERRQQQHVVTPTAAGDQGGPPHAVGAGGEEIRAGGQHVGEGRGGPGAVPGGEGGGPEVLPG